MKNVIDIIGAKAAQALFDAGYMVCAKDRDALCRLDLPPDAIPASRSYQWLSLEHDRSIIECGWSPVHHEQHDGYFAPHGQRGPIVIGGMGLFSKPKYEVEAQLRDNRALAEALPHEVMRRAGEAGLVGGARVAGQIIVAAGDDQSNTSTQLFRVPAHLLPRMGEIFARRDEILATSPDDSSPSSRADALRAAIVEIDNEKDQSHAS